MKAKKEFTEDEQQLTELRKKDPKFVQLMLEASELTEPSPELRKKVVEMARAHKRKLEREAKLNNSDWLMWLEPMITPIKDLRAWFTLEGFLPSNLRVLVGLFLIVSVISGLSYLVYYQYQISSNTNKDNLISNQTPIIKATPIVIPSPMITPTFTPNNITENNKPNNDNKLNKSAQKQNNQKNVITKDQQQNKPNKIKKETLDANTNNNQIVYEANRPDNSSNSIEDVSKGDVLRGGIVDLSLLEINQFYIGSFGDGEENKLLKQALVERLQNTDFELLTASQSLSTDNYGEIVKKGDLIQIINPSNDSVLWYRSVKEKGSAKEVANSLVNTLLEDIKNQQKK